MPVVSMMRIPGDPDDLHARMDEHLRPVSDRLAAQHGGLLNIVARDGDNGILVINVWETEEGRHAMAAEPRFGRLSPRPNSRPRASRATRSSRSARASGSPSTRPWSFDPTALCLAPQRGARHRGCAKDGKAA